MSYEPLHHKYRPQTFAELVGQDAIATTLTNAIRTAKIAPAYLFIGPRGTGKTSSARILAKSLNCLSSKVPTEKPCGVCAVCQGIAKGSALDVIEIDAASNTGVDNIRELIERAQFAPVQCRYKVYVIDECHMLSTAAFNALLKTLEEPPARVVFVLATTDEQRVLPTIISRCQRFDFRRIATDAMVAHLSAIATKENINITQSAVLLIAQVAQGGLRDAESLLDQLSLLAGQVTVERVWDLVGSCSEPDLIELLQAIAHSKPEAVLDCARRIMDCGREPLTILQNLAGFYRDLLIAKTAPSRSDLVAVTPSTWIALCQQAVLYDVSTILARQQHLAKSEVQIKNTTQPRLWLEVTLLGLLPSASYQQAISKLSAPSSQSLGNGVTPPTTQPVERSEVTPHRTPAQPPHPIAPVNKAVDNNSASLAQSVPPGSQPPLPERHLEASSESISIPESPAIVESPPSASQPSVVDSQTSGEQIWQQVLANLQPISTQALLRQMGHLIEFDGTLARIGIKSPKWCDRAKDYLPNIKAAFQAMFNREVQVRLELATQTKTVSGVTTPASPQITEPRTSHFAATSTFQAKALTSVQPAITLDKSTTLNSAPKMDVAAYNPANTVEWQDDEVAIAAQRLAEFFNGEVVKLNSDSAFSQATTHNQSPPIVTPAPEMFDCDAEDADIEF
jgi:DNA polymerase-3 subunit gamma/tau